MKKFIFILAIIIISMTLMTACSGKVTFESLVISADNAYEIKEGNYTLNYSIKNIQEFSKQYKTELIVKVVDEVLEPVEVKNNRTFEVEKDKKYSVTITIVAHLEEGVKTKNFVYSLVAEKSDPKIEFKLPNGDIQHTESVKYGKSTDIFALLQKVGEPEDFFPENNTYEYTILSRCWLLETDSGNITIEQSHFDNVTEDIIIRADYEYDKNVRTYTITFDTDGGNEVPSISGNFGYMVGKQPQVPIREGYGFVGWRQTGAIKSYYRWERAVFDKDITLKAEWVKDNIEDKSYLDNFVFEKYTVPQELRDYYIIQDAKETLPSDVIIPNVYNGLWVGKIDPRVFGGNENIEKVTFSEGFDTTNSLSMFKNCTNLKEVVFDKNVEVNRIFNEMFSGCSSLTSIKIPDSVTYIGAKAFAGCYKLSEIIFSQFSKIDTVGINNATDNSYQGCIALTEIKLPTRFSKVDRKLLPFDDGVEVTFYS